MRTTVVAQDAMYNLKMNVGLNYTEDTELPISHCACAWTASGTINPHLQRCMICHNVVQLNQHVGE